MNKNSSTVFIFIIAFLLGVIIYLSKCHSTTNTTPVDKKFEAQHAADSLKLLAQADTIKGLNRDIDYQSYIIMDKDSTLLLLGDQVDFLMKHRVKPIPGSNFKNIILDTTSYILDCENCFDLLSRGKDSVVAYIKEIKKRDSLIILKDTAIAVEQRFQESLFKGYVQQYRDLYAKSKQKKAAFGIGIEYVYSPSYTNIGAWIEYMDKKGRIFGINGGRTTLQTWYAGGRIGIALFH